MGKPEGFFQQFGREENRTL